MSSDRAYIVNYVGLHYGGEEKLDSICSNLSYSFNTQATYKSKLEMLQ